MSRLPFELLLALRYLRPKRTFVSVITLISVLGVTLGVAVLIIVISVMSGFDQQLRDRILGFNPHIRILARGGTLKDYRDLERIVSSNRNVTAVAPFVMGPVLVETEPANGQPQVGAPWIRGVVPRFETNTTVLAKSIVAGKFDVGDRGVLIGTEFADKMSLNVGDRIEIGSPSMLRKWSETKTKPVLPEYDVRGIFDVGYYEYDLSVIVVSLQDAQELYDLDGDVQGLTVMLRDPYKARTVAAELEQTIGYDYRIMTWMEENGSLLSAVQVEKNVMFYVLFFIVIVAAMSILSALITFVVQKTREIGMLKALGATDLQVGLLFLSQAAMVGALGDPAGCGLAMLALAYRNEVLHFLRHWTGFELFPASIYGFSELPAVIVQRDILVICGSAWVVCMLGGVIPAWRAARLKPVEALRNE
ncbi:MAG TPA: ABC transporter permease [Candidatus Acidoferrum sp.]|nr:ABC transporter permease [Candidatus Acidoferrum sp.]